MNRNTHFHGLNKKRCGTQACQTSIRSLLVPCQLPAHLPGRLSVLPNTAAASMPGCGCVAGGRRDCLSPRVPPKGPPKDDVMCCSAHTASRHAAGPRSFQVWKCLTLCQLLVVFWEILLSADIPFSVRMIFVFERTGQFSSTTQC